MLARCEKKIPCLFQLNSEATQLKLSEDDVEGPSPPSLKLPDISRQKAKSLLDTGL